MGAEAARKVLDAQMGDLELSGKVSGDDGGVVLILMIDIEISEFPFKRSARPTDTFLRKRGTGLPNPIEYGPSFLRWRTTVAATCVAIPRA
jgi:hypothetical protein